MYGQVLYLYDFIAYIMNDQLWQGLQKSTIWVQKIADFFCFCSIITYELFTVAK